MNMNTQPLLSYFTNRKKPGANLQEANSLIINFVDLSDCNLFMKGNLDYKSLQIILKYIVGFSQSRCFIQYI